MLEKKISNVSSTLIINSYEGFYINSSEDKKKTTKILRDKYDSKGLIKLSRLISDDIETEIISESEHNFKPFGDSSTILIKSKKCLTSSGNLHLKESHISFHTYIEDILDDFLIIRLELHVCSCSESNVFNSLKSVLPRDFLSLDKPSPDLITIDYLRRGSKHHYKSQQLLYDYSDFPYEYFEDNYEQVSNLDLKDHNGTRNIIFKSRLKPTIEKFSRYDFKLPEILIEKYRKFLLTNYTIFSETKSSDAERFRDNN